MAKTGGRKKGVPNKATREIKAYAQEYGREAIDKLVNILRSDKSSDQAQVAAVKELLDRGYGKSSQPLSGSEDEPPIKTVLEVVWGTSNGSGS